MRNGSHGMKLDATTFMTNLFLQKLAASLLLQGAAF